ncbi:MAG: hypothetical protein JO323_14330 [Acidobacteriia bacterium]|nr:hypothetical protein [Terriglobia bacterium]
MMTRALLLLLSAAQFAGAAPCFSPRDVPNGAHLDDLALRYLGSSRYAVAIALATNARTDEGFPYIASLDDLTGVSRVCVPSKSEARDLERSWRRYVIAVNAARLPQISDVSNGSLLVISRDQPVDLVSWVRKDQADKLKTADGSWATAAPFETWVTVENHLQQFCRAFVRDHGPDETKLIRRMEQHLGLPPAGSKSYFVRLELEHPGPDTIFRPCVDPATDHAGCGAGPPSKAVPSYQQWFYQQYYSSYGQSLLGEFPWTSLGYTFDWGPAAKPGSKFARTGESEFVVYKNAPIKVLGVVPTAQYCAP